VVRRQALGEQAFRRTIALEGSMRHELCLSSRRSTVRCRLAERQGFCLRERDWRSSRSWC